MLLRCKKLGALSLLLCALGCNQSASTSETNGKPTPVKQQARNQLLERLAGLDKDEKLQVLLSLVQDDSDKLLRRESLSYLASLGTDIKPIADSLVNLLLEEKDDDVFRRIKLVLVESQASVEVSLLSAVPNAHNQQLLRIMETLRDTRASSPATLEFLQQQLASSSSELVIAGCKALEQIGPAGRSTLPLLLAIAERPRVALDGSSDAGQEFRESRDLAGAAIRAIAVLGPDASTVPALTGGLAMEPQIAAVAADTLARVGAKAASAIPALEELKNRDDHGGHDVKTRLAREAALKAINALKSTGERDTQPQ